MTAIETVKFPITKNPYTGTELPTKLEGSFEFSEYETRSEIPDGERLTDEQYVTAVNARRKASLRAKTMTKVLKDAGIERPDQNSAEVVEANQIKLYQKMFPGMTEEQAKQTLEASKKIAASLVGA